MEEEKRLTLAPAGPPTPQGRVVTATVKGDVHDIGKNIVGVVLGCNNYEVIDLGVMVPADLILDTAIEGCDIVGCSGLITPSLDEMVNVAREMERRGMDLPLLIGGATTSRQHTAVRIAPAYGQPVVHVLDASRVVGVVSALLDPERKAMLDGGEPRAAGTAAGPARGAGTHPAAPLPARDREPHVRSTGAPRTSPTPTFTGLRIVEPSLEALRGFIDWTFFFTAWELKGRYPADPRPPRPRPGGPRALRERERAAGRDRRRRIDLTARGVYGFWPAASRRATTSCWTNGRVVPDAPAAGRQGRRPSEPLARRLRRARRDRARRSRGRVRGHGRPRRRRARRSGTRPTTTTIGRSW